jgi:hypothetical protein
MDNQRRNFEGGTSIPVLVSSAGLVWLSVLGFLAAGSSTGGEYFPLKGYRTSARLNQNSW